MKKLTKEQLINEFLRKENFNRNEECKIREAMKDKEINNYCTLGKRIDSVQEYYKICFYDGYQDHMICRIKITEYNE